MPVTGISTTICQKNTVNGLITMTEKILENCTQFKLESDKYTCVKCASGYVFKTDKCEKSIFPESNCYEEDTEGCTKCAPGYFPETTSKICIKYMDHCIEQTAVNVCTTCELFYEAIAIDANTNYCSKIEAGNVASGSFDNSSGALTFSVDMCKNDIGYYAPKEYTAPTGSSLSNIEGNFAVCAKADA